MRSLKFLLETLEDRYCADARDKDFAALGLVDYWGNAARVAPDYTHSLNEVYFLATTHILQMSGNLHVLVDGWPQLAHAEPSWGLNFNTGRRRDESLLSLAERVWHKVRQMTAKSRLERSHAIERGSKRHFSVTGRTLQLRAVDLGNPLIQCASGQELELPKVLIGPSVLIHGVHDCGRQQHRQWHPPDGTRVCGLAVSSRTPEHDAHLKRKAIKIRNTTGGYAE